MEDLKSIIIFLVFAFFFMRLVGFPIIHSIKNLIKLLKLKKQIQNFGKEIIPLNRKQEIKIWLIILYIIFGIFMIVFGITAKVYLVLLGPIVLVPMILDFILIRKFTEFNGIYENGIVIGSFLEWKDVFSWEIIDNNKISILKQDGLRFDLETDEKTNSVIEYFIKKGISEENELEN